MTKKSLCQTMTHCDKLYLSWEIKALSLLNKLQLLSFKMPANRDASFSIFVLFDDALGKAYALMTISVRETYKHLKKY